MKIYLAPMVFIFFSASAAIAPAEEKSDRLIPSVTVVGTGEAREKPDIASISVGLSTQAPTPAEALAKNTKTMQTLMDTLRQHGIEERDIQTSNISFRPLYENYPGASKVTGYQVDNQVFVKVRQIPKLGELLDLLVRGGANQIHGISFSIDDPEPVMIKARQQAIQKARRHAEQYAAEAGVKVGRTLLIQEEPIQMPQMMMGMRGMAAEAASVPIAPGESTLSARVTVTFALLPVDGP